MQGLLQAFRDVGSDPAWWAAHLGDPLSAQTLRQAAAAATTYLLNYFVACEKLLERSGKEHQTTGWQRPVIESLGRSAKGELECSSQAKLVYVKRLSKGRLFPDHKMPYDAALQTLRDEHPDIVVDEHEHYFQAPGSPQGTRQAIIPLRKMQRGMLCLVFKNVGGYLEHEDIGGLFNFKVRHPGGGVDERIYQYRIELGRLVGESLRDKMMTTGSNQTYLLPAKSWSFVWIRMKADVEQSELVWRIRRPPCNAVQQTV